MTDTINGRTRRPRRRGQAAVVCVLTTVGLLAAGGATALADEWYDPAALNTSCAEEVDGLGRADRCRFEPWTKENFTGDVVRVSGDTVNCTAVDATKSIVWSQSTTEENSIQVAVGVDLTLSKDVFSASITTTYGHSWSHTTTETNIEQAPVPAGSVAWIERGAPMQRVTGRMVINFPERRHGHYEWYTYPTVVNADPEALGHSTVILRSRPVTPEENTRLCGGTAAPPAPAGSTVLRAPEVGAPAGG